MTTSSTLAQTTLAHLRTTFDTLGHRPSVAMWEALADLALCLERMADGECEPRYYLSSLDPGVGKTQTVIHFLRALLASPQHDDVGVLLCMFSLREVEDVVSQAKLHRGDFCVRTSNDELNVLGSADPSSARVLFTTQQRLQKVCTNRRLGDVESFMFKGRPRRVRIWDESLLPADPITLRRDEIALLFKELRRSYPKLANELEALFGQLKEPKDRSVFKIPDFAHAHSIDLSRVIKSISVGATDVIRAASNLWYLSGRSAAIRMDGVHGGTLVGYREALPSDLAPVVILDASGRLRTAYKLWEKERGTLTRLKSASKRYGNLKVHLWEAGGGESSFHREGDWKVRCDAIAAAINTKPREPWLVVCHKRNSERLRSHVAGLLTTDADRVRIIHWGIHRASNEYRDIPNVILAGTEFLPQSVYEAIGRAAADLDPKDGTLTEAQERELALGEHQHRILQALCRASVRKAVGDSCAPCNAYIIASRRSGIGAVIPHIFPGCNVEQWEPVKGQLAGYVGSAVEFVLEWFDEHPGEFLPFQVVMAAIDLKDASNFRKRVRLHFDFQQAMQEASIVEESDTGSARPRGFIKQDAAYYGFKIEEGWDGTEHTESATA